MSELTFLDKNDENERFDFERHKQKSITQYVIKRPLYEAYSSALKNILEQCLKENRIKIHSIEARAKSVESFGEKAAKPMNDNPSEPKYIDPMNQITDMAGIRIITFFPSNIDEVDRIIHEELDVKEKSDKSDLLDREERLGYQSVHYLVKLKESRSSLNEYKQFKGLMAEIQLRTILQHAWAEIEHDIEYKSVITIPPSIKRRFMALAGMLQIADREFQAIQDDDEKLRKEARESLLKGNLKDVEITSDALKAYLDKRLGPDGRMSDFSYNFEAEILIKMGFTDFKQIDDCLNGYDDDKVSKILWGTRQGQISRFEETLLASMGEEFIKRHPWSNEQYWVQKWQESLEKLTNAGIGVGNQDNRGAMDT